MKKTLPRFTQERSLNFLKVICSIAVLMLCSISITAQVVIIPSANDNDDEYRQPLGTYYGYERTAMIYTAAEVGQSGNISTIAFYLNSKGAAGNAPIKVYMKHRTGANFGTLFAGNATTFAAEISGATTVFSGTIPASSLSVGWNTITLTTTFAYNGTSPLAVMIETNATGSGNEGAGQKSFRWSTTGTTYRAQTWANDGSAPGGNGSLVNGGFFNFECERPNIKLNFAAALPVITGISPLSVCPGEEVTITGTNLSGATAVNIGATSGTVTGSSATTVTATFAAAASGKVTVTAPGGTSAASTQTLTVNATPSAATLVVSGTVCSNPRTITASGTGTIFYKTSAGVDGTSTPYTAPISITTAGISTYYFRIRSASGCWGPENSLAVTISNTSTPLTATGAGTFCGSTSIGATGGSGGTIYFQGTNATGQSTVSGGSPQTINTSGTYYFRENNACGWGPAAAVNVTINPNPTAVTVSGPATFCNTATITATGGTGGTIYFQGTTPNGTSTAIPSASEVVSVGGTYYFRAQSAAGCWGPEGSVTVTKVNSFTITGQPSDKIACTGTSTNFTVATSTNAGLSYQWRKGTVNLANTGSRTGVNTATLTINPVATGDAATDYNCVVTDGCGAVITNFVSLTVNIATPAPTTQPSNTPVNVVNFPTIGATSVIGTYDFAPDAFGYLVVRRTTNTTPATPVQGVSYPVGGVDLLGANTYIEYVGPNNFFSSNGLNQNTTYYYWVYALNYSDCGANSIVYNTTNPLKGSITTSSNTGCSSTSNVWWIGNGSLYNVTGAGTNGNFNKWQNWTFSPSEPPSGSASFVSRNNPSTAIPTQCNNVTIRLSSDAIIRQSENAEISDLNLYVQGGGTLGRLFNNGKTLIVNGNADIDSKSGNANTGVFIGDEPSGDAGIMDFKANVKIGTTNTNATSGFIGNSKNKIIFRGNLTLGKTAGNYSDDDIAQTVVFDGKSLLTQQVLWSNDVHYSNFRNVVIGELNSPVVIHVTGSYRPDNIYGNLTINNAAVLDLGTSQWIRETGGGTFAMNGTSKLRLANDTAYRSTPASGSPTGVIVAGSNFPGGFNCSFAAGSTVEYYGSAALVKGQRIYEAPTYGNLTLSNGPATGNALKYLTANLPPITGDLSIGKNTTYNMAILTSNRNGVGGAMSMGSNSFLKITGSTGGRTGSNFPANFSTHTLDATSTVEYNSPTAVNQTVFAGLSYGNLTLTNGTAAASATTTKTLGGNITSTIAGKLLVNPYVVFDLAAFSANKTTGTGVLTVSNNSLLRLSGSTGGQTGSNFPSGFSAYNLNPYSTVEYSGAAQTLYGGVNYANLSLAGTGVKTAPATLNISEALNKTTATTFAHAGGLVQFNGLIAQDYTAVAPLMDFYDLTNLNGTASGLKLNSGLSIAHTLTLSSGSVMILNADITLKSMLAGTASVAQLLTPATSISYGTGRFVVERYINTGLLPSQHRKSWQLLAAPTSGQTIKESWMEGTTGPNGNPNPNFGTQITGPGGWTNGFDLNSTDPSMKTFNTVTGTWTGVPSTNIQINNTRGYLVFVRGDRSVINFSGANSDPKPTVLRTRGKINAGVNASPSVAVGKFESVANPYPSAIDYSQVSRTGGVTPNFYLFDCTLQGTRGLGGYQSITAASGYKAVPGNLGANPSSLYNSSSNYKNIQSGQAFFITAIGSGGNINFKETDKSGGSTLVNRGEADQLMTLRTNLLTGNGAATELADGNLVAFDNGYNNDVDADDAAKVLNAGENFGLSRNGISLSVEARRSIVATDTIFYKMNTMRAMPYRLMFIPENLAGTGATAELIDRYLQTRTPVSMQDTNYVGFSVTTDPQSAAANRFMLVFKPSLVLPVTITSIAANRNNDRSIAVKWTVENEVNIEKYTIERSADGRAFTSILTNDATNSRNYTKNDLSPLSADNFYRIRAQSIGGLVQYSAIVKVAPLKENGTISVYPNPVENKNAQVVFTGQAAGNYSIQITNNLGQTVYSGSVKVTGTSFIKAVPLGPTASAGIYQLKVMSADGTVTSQQLTVQ